MRILLSLFVLSVASLMSSAIAETSTNSQLTAGEQQLVSLMTDFYSELENFWAAGRDYETPEEFEKALKEGTLVDPNAEYIPKLLEFEAEHRGDDVGLLALWRVFREAARGGNLDSPATVGRREGAARLDYYADCDLLPLVAATTLNGKNDTQVYELINELVRSGKLPQRTRDLLYFTLGEEAFEIRDTLNALAKRLEALRTGAEPSWPGELDSHAAWLENSLSAEEVEQRCQASVEMLKELASDNDSPRMWGLKGIDERFYVVRIVEDSSRPLLAELASALLFKELHLKAGSTAPELEVKLLDESIWRMADQRDKVVVVQFSFTGCNPCELMYPDLAALIEEFGDRISILTLMRDKTPENAIYAIESGKMTWNISLDGDPGRIATAWSVRGFPETYVINQTGTISAHGLRGEPLRQEIERLLDKAG